jgi:hypothetical protein
MATPTEKTTAIIERINGTDEKHVMCIMVRGGSYQVLKIDRMTREIVGEDEFLAPRLGKKVVDTFGWRGQIKVWVIDRQEFVNCPTTEEMGVRDVDYGNFAWAHERQAEALSYLLNKQASFAVQLTKYTDLVELNRQTGQFTVCGTFDATALKGLTELAYQWECLQRAEASLKAAEEALDEIKAEVAAKGINVEVDYTAE